MKPLTKARFWLLSNSSLSRRLMWLTDANLSTRSWVADRRLEEKEAATFSHTLLGAIFQFQRDIMAERRSLSIHFYWGWTTIGDPGQIILDRLIFIPTIFFNVIYSDEFGYCNHLNFNLIDCKLPNEAKIFFGLLFDHGSNCRKYIRFHFWTTSDITIAD